MERKVERTAGPENRGKRRAAERGTLEGGRGLERNAVGALGAGNSLRSAVEVRVVRRNGSMSVDTTRSERRIEKLNDVGGSDFDGQRESSHSASYQSMKPCAFAEMGL